MTAINISSVCHFLNKEAKYTMSICHQLIQEVQYYNYEERVQSSLILFAQQIKQNTPEVTAAGFFSINYSLLLSILGSVATQLIVLLQLNLSK